MASLSLPVNIKKLLADQQAAIIANTDAKATATNTEIANKATATQAVIVADGDVTQATLDAMTVVDGQLDNNVTAINNHTSLKVGAVKTSVIGDVKSLNVADVNGLAIINGESWIKSGVIETDVNLYPDSKKYYSVLVGNEYNDMTPTFTLGSMLTVFVHTENNYWVANSSNGDLLHEFTLGGAKTGRTITMNGPVASPRGGCWNGLVIATTDSDKDIDTWTEAGVHAKLTTAVEMVYGGIDLAYVNGAYWVTDGSNIIYIYDSATGDYIESKEVSFKGVVESITSDGVNVWVATSSLYFYKLDLQGVVLQEAIRLPSSLVRISHDQSTGKLFFVGLDGGYRDMSVYDFVGLYYESVGAQTLLPYYLRVK